jgi:hypothetical protein
VWCGLVWCIKCADSHNNIPPSHVSSLLSHLLYRVIIKSRIDQLLVPLANNTALFCNNTNIGLPGVLRGHGHPVPPPPTAPHHIRWSACVQSTRLGEGARRRAFVCALEAWWIKENIQHQLWLCEDDELVRDTNTV